MLIIYEMFGCSFSQLAFIQETRIKHNTKEARKEYTWYFSGENGRETYTAGVGMIINNKYIQHIDDIEPINDRLMRLTLKGSLPVTIINTYIPTADRPQQEKDIIYEDIKQIIRKHKNKGPTYLVGEDCLVGTSESSSAIYEELRF